MRKTVLSKFTISVLLTISACWSFSDPGKLSVNGSATIFVEPDKVMLDLYTQHSAESAKQVNQKISDTMKQMLEIARAAHILKKDLSTSGIAINAYRQQNDNCSNLNHQARQSLR